MTGAQTGVLLSYWYYGRHDLTRLHAECPIVLDSGAFTAYTQGSHIDLATYARWVQHARSLRTVRWALNLDVIGDEHASFDNWKRLHDAGVDTVPVIHFGQHPETMLPKYLEAGAQRVALGGVAGAGTTRQSVGWTAHCLRWARANAPGLPVHGLGVHMRARLARLPFHSTDASTVVSSLRYGRAFLWDQRRHRWEQVAMNGTGDVYDHGRLIRAYGVNPADVDTARSTNRRHVFRLVVGSEIAAARHAGTTRRYLVDTSTSHMDDITALCAELQAN